MKFRSLMTAICVLATASIVSAAPFAYIANSGTHNVSVIDTATNSKVIDVALPDTGGIHPYAYGVAVSASGQHIYVGLQDTNNVAVIDAATYAVVHMIGLGSDSPGGLAVNAAETRLYVASNKSNTLIVIDITGGGAAEVGRVAVENASLSNPAGVVLNSVGNKAYVANSSTGTVAEISLDETNNLFTRTSLTTVGGNPVGLALSSDGSKLYVANLVGAAAAVIETATKVVTALKDAYPDGPLTIGTGNVTMAISSDNSKVYAPSNSLDKLYVINAAVNPNVVLATQYSIPAGPYGSSLTPDDSKLYLTMNTASAGETVKVFDTTSNTVTATINLPAGAKPTSLGNFIGPVLPYTITASKGGSCIISPEGAIPVNIKGRSFDIVAPSGTCDVRVDGVFLNTYSAFNYTFSNVSADHAITAFPPAATFTVTGNWTGEAAGCLEIPSGSGCATQGTPVAVTAGSKPTIKANSGFKAQAWTGACAGTITDTCILPPITANVILGANIVVGGGPIFNVTKAVYYQTFAEAMVAASTNDQIKVASTYTLGGTTAGTATQVLLSSGWDPNFSIPSVSTMGALVITSTGLVVDSTAGYTLTL